MMRRAASASAAGVSPLPRSWSMVAPPRTAAAASWARSRPRAAASSRMTTSRSDAVTGPRDAVALDAVALGLELRAEDARQRDRVGVLARRAREHVVAVGAGDEEVEVVVRRIE